jgi:hypothetical protein
MSFLVIMAVINASKRLPMPDITLITM